MAKSREIYCVARMGVDEDQVHCSEVPIRAEGTKTVIVNGAPWSCVGHHNHPHKGIPCVLGCCVHVAPICRGSSSVFVEGRPAGRVGDPVAACTFVATGSPNVICGG